MADLNQILTLLTDQRRALLEQVKAVDDAIAALHRAEAVADAPAAAPAMPDEPAASVPSDDPVAVGGVDEVLPRRVTPKRVLSDSHKEALKVGARHARNVRETRKGTAREALGDSFVPAVGKRRAAEPPRLVKKSR